MFWSICLLGAALLGTLFFWRLLWVVVLGLWSVIFESFRSPVLKIIMLILALLLPLGLLAGEVGLWAWAITDTIESVKAL